MRHLIHRWAFCLFTCLLGASAWGQDGTLDATFHFSGPIADTIDQISFLSIQPDGEILIKGHKMPYYPEHLLRTNVNGNEEPSFSAIAETAIDSLYPNVIQAASDGSIWVGGSRNTNGYPVKILHKLNAAGRLDTLFRGGYATPSTISNGAAVYALDYKQDGQMVVSGIFRNLDGINNKNIAEYKNLAGTPNTNFHTDVNLGWQSTPPSGLKPISLQPDGKLLVMTSQFVNNLIRLDTLGGVDTAFHPQLGGYEIEEVKALPDGSMLLSHHIRNDTYGTMHLWADGSVDSTYRCSSPGQCEYNGWATAYHRYYSFIPLPDGKSLAIQYIYDIPGSNTFTVVRLTDRGMIDSSFQAPIFSLPLSFITLQGEKILVVANYDRSEWLDSIPHIFRLNNRIDTIKPVVLQPNFNAARRRAYEGDSIRFNNSTAAHMWPSLVAYTWSLTPDTGWAFAAGSDSASVNPVIRFTKAGSYSINLQSRFGSQTADTTKDAYITVVPIPAPQPNFRVNSRLLHVGDSATFTNLTRPPVAPRAVAYTWAARPDTGWAFAAQSTAGSINPVIKFTEAGSYSIRLTATVGIQMSDTLRAGYIVVERPAATRTIAKLEVKPYPNPASNFTTLALPIQAAAQPWVWTDALGRQQVALVEATPEGLRFSTEGLAAWVYRLSSLGGTAYHVVVQR